MSDWLDPGYCSHGVTYGCRCTKCGGTAQPTTELIPEGHDQ